MLIRILLKREDLKVIITSATISAETYIEYFNEFKVEAITIEGRTHPVDIYYLASPCKNYIEKAIETALAIHKSQPPGDILVFLTGQEDISAFISALSQENSLTVLPLHASLSTENQLKVFSTAHPHRKIIASTNIAETAVTIEGILYVIDCCFVKQKTFIGGFECLSTFPISKAQAVQRAGRAGRLRPGKCYRLCTESSFSALRNENIAEILRVDLSPTIVYLKSLCIHNIPAFPFITQPHKNSILTALEMLYNLGAIDENGFLTSEVGEALVELPIDHKLAVVLLNSCTENFRCSKEILSIVAMLSVQGIFNGRPNENILMTKRRLGAKEGDHPSLLNIFEQFAKIPSFNERKKFCQDHRLNMRALQRVGKIRDQLRGILQKLRLNIVSCEYDVESILRCLVTGLFSNAAQREPNGVYRISNCNEEFQLHPSSILSVIKPEWLVFTEVLQTDKKYLVDASEIDADWLYELAPNYFTDTRDIKMHMQHKKLLS